MKAMRKFYHEIEPIILFKENRTLTIITIIAVANVFFYYVTYDIPEIISGINRWLELLVTLSIGLIVNYLFFLVQVYYPKRKKEKEAQRKLQKALDNVYFLLVECCWVTDNMFKGLDRGEVIKTQEIVYYKYTTDKGCAYGTKINAARYRNEIREMRKYINEMMSMRVFLECSVEYIEMIENLYENKVFSKMELAVTAKCPVSTVYPYLVKEREMLSKITEQIENTLGKKIVASSMNTEEKRFIDARIKKEEIDDNMYCFLNGES